jgi:hypothetical protein
MIQDPFIYNHSLCLLECIEAEILGRAEPQNRWEPFPLPLNGIWNSVAEMGNRYATSLFRMVHMMNKAVIWPIPFLVSGAKVIRNWVLFWIISVFALSSLTDWGLQYIRFKDAAWVSFIPWVVLAGATFWTLFPVPSLYAGHAIQTKEMETTLNFLEGRGLTKEEDLQKLREILKSMEEPAKRRISIYRLMLNFMWAGAIYLFGKVFDHFWSTTFEKATGSTPPQAAFQKIVLPFLISLAIYATLHLLIAAYEVAVNRLFRSAEFGLLEAMRGTRVSEEQPSARVVEPSVRVGDPNQGSEVSMTRLPH